MQLHTHLEEDEKMDCKGCMLIEEKFLSTKL